MKAYGFQGFVGFGLGVSLLSEIPGRSLELQDCGFIASIYATSG